MGWSSCPDLFENLPEPVGTGGKRHLKNGFFPSLQVRLALHAQAFDDPADFDLFFDLRLDGFFTADSSIACSLRASPSRKSWAVSS
jgi:hypothetical protein